MPRKIYSKEEEQCIQDMIELGMKIGEIQVFFSSSSDRKIIGSGKKVGIDVHRNATLKERNISRIKSYIMECIEKGIIEETARGKQLLEDIDDLKPTPNGRSYFRKSLQQNAQVGRHQISTKPKAVSKAHRQQER